MKNIFFLFIFSAAVTGCVSQNRTPPGPNIVLILSDDMGYSDIGCYGGVIETPVLDGLAKNGLRFTQFYNSARCCPTRASLLTGLYPHQAGLGLMTGREAPGSGYQGDLSVHAVTLAEALKQAGYSTYLSGKWHVTPCNAKEKHPSKDNWPLQRGFDQFFGTIFGAGSFYDPMTLVRQNEYINPGEGFYYTDAITDHAVDFIEHHQGEEPFFLYLSYTAAHWPMHAKPEDIEKYKGRFDDGWDVLRRKKYKQMQAMGLIKPEWNLSEKDDIPDWEDEPQKEWQSSLMEVYAAMVDCMDQGIGRVMEALESRGLKENTLVVFLEDNGGCSEDFINRETVQPYYKDVSADEIKPMGKDERQTEMVPRYTRDGRPVLSGKGLLPGAANTYMAYGKPWANVSNVPFRMYKHYVHEGGIATPLIVHWPAGIQTRNEFRDQPAHIIDIMATCIDVAGANYPETFNGQPIQPMEGVSLVPAFDNEPLQERPLFWEHEGNKAIRLGKYKLVSMWEEGEPYNWELYDLESDRSETVNLIDQMPEQAALMERMWKDWARRAGVLSWKTFQPIE